MFDTETLKSLETGDKIMAGPLMKGLSPESVVLIAKSLNPPEANWSEFDASYFGISLGTWRCKLLGDKLIWEGLPE